MFSFSSTRPPSRPRGSVFSPNPPHGRISSSKGTGNPVLLRCLDLHGSDGAEEQTERGFIYEVERGRARRGMGRLKRGPDFFIFSFFLRKGDNPICPKESHPPHTPTPPTLFFLVFSFFVLALCAMKTFLRSVLSLFLSLLCPLLFKLRF